MNPGNSGGPVLVNDKLIGIATSILPGAQNIGYVIPSEEIELFLSETQNGRYTGKPFMGEAFQTLENPALRAFLNLNSSTHGDIVLKPFSDDPHYPLKKWDVVTKIGDVPVDDQGMILVRQDVRLYFTYMVQKTYKDGTVPLTIVRSGKEMQIQLPVQTDRSRLIPYLAGSFPPYFIFGPVVFSIASEDFLDSVLGQTAYNAQVLGLLSALESPLLFQRNAESTPEKPELVIVASPFFTNKYAIGYDSHQLRTVKAVNGVQIKSLKHLVETIRDSQDPFIVIDFQEGTSESLVFPRQETEASTTTILADNGIRERATPELLAMWNQKGTAANQ
jgi:hypothetical protein